MPNNMKQQSPTSVDDLDQSDQATKNQGRGPVCSPSRTALQPQLSPGMVRVQSSYTRVTRTQKRVGHKVWRVWWGGVVDCSATKKARQTLMEKALDKLGSCVVRIHERKTPRS